MADANDTADKKGSESAEGADDQELDLDDEDDDSDDDAAAKGDKGADGEKKPKETPEAKRARLERELKQHNKKYPTSEEKPKPASKKGDFDYGQKAFLIASGIKGEAETALVQEYVNDSGKSIETILSNKAFQSDLKELRDSDKASDAIPDSKRSGNSSRDSVEYWITKGEMPANTPENQELRRKIVNAKMAKAKGGSPFTSTPVVS